MYKYIYYIHRSHNYTNSLYRYHMLEVKIGRRIYPHYDIVIDKPLFTSREDFDRCVCVCVFRKKIDSVCQILTPSTERTGRPRGLTPNRITGLSLSGGNFSSEASVVRVSDIYLISLISYKELDRHSRSLFSSCAFVFYFHVLFNSS